jgi:hypothetical protein
MQKTQLSITAICFLEKNPIQAIIQKPFLTDSGHLADSEISYRIILIEKLSYG